MENKWDGKERRAEGVSIPYPLIAIVFTLIIQTLGGVWWASAMNAKMEYLQDGQAKLEIAIINASSNRYTSLDASRDWAVNERRLNSIESTINENKKSIIELQIKNGATK